MNRYRFILDSFGLFHSRPVIFIPGKPISSYPGPNAYSNLGQPSSDVVNMSTSPDGSTPMSSQLLGLPVFADLILKENATPGRELQLLQVLLTVSQQRVIVKTAMQGRNGTVKEYISDGDYQVNIQGAFYDRNPERYPIENVSELLSLLRIPAAITVVSEYLSLFNISQLVVENYDFPQVAGHQNSQTFSIRALSDEPIELQLSND